MSIGKHYYSGFDFNYDVLVRALTHADTGENAVFIKKNSNNMSIVIGGNNDELKFEHTFHRFGNGRYETTTYCRYPDKVIMWSDFWAKHRLAVFEMYDKLTKRKIALSYADKFLREGIPTDTGELRFYVFHEDDNGRDIIDSLHSHNIIKTSANVSPV
jgi:hypothetical protein